MKENEWRKSRQFQKFNFIQILILKIILLAKTCMVAFKIQALNDYKTKRRKKIIVNLLEISNNFKILNMKIILDSVWLYADSIALSDIHGKFVKNKILINLLFK